MKQQQPLPTILNGNELVCELHPKILVPFRLSFRDCARLTTVNSAVILGSELCVIELTLLFVISRPCALDYIRWYV